MIKAIGLFLICLLCAGCTSIPNSGVIASPVATQTVVTPTVSTVGDLTGKNSLACGVSVGVPAEKSKYTDSSSPDQRWVWRFTEREEPSEYWWYRLDRSVTVGRVQADGLGSGYNPGNILIGWVDAKIATLDDFYSDYKKRVVGNKEFMGERVQVGLDHEQRLHKWGEEVVVFDLVVGVQRSAIFLTVHNGRGYLVSKSSDSKDSEVLNQLDRVVDSISFI